MSSKTGTIPGRITARAVFILFGVITAASCSTSLEGTNTNWLEECNDGTGRSDCCSDKVVSNTACGAAPLECFTPCEHGYRGHFVCSGGVWLAGHGLFPCGSDAGAEASTGGTGGTVGTGATGGVATTGGTTSTGGAPPCGPDAGAQPCGEGQICVREREVRVVVLVPDEPMRYSAFVLRVRREPLPGRGVQRRVSRRAHMHLRDLLIAAPRSLSGAAAVKSDAE